jgi:hypothetical protein
MMSDRVRHLKKGDTVVALSGSCLGLKGKVLAVGIIEQLRWWPACKFQVCDSHGKKLGRVGFKMVGDKKERVFSGERKK